MKKFLSQPRVLLVGLITAVLSGLVSTYYWFLNSPGYNYLAVEKGRTWGRAIRSDAVDYYSWIPTVLQEFPHLCFKSFADSSTFIQTLQESSFHQYVANSECYIPPHTVGLSIAWIPMWITVHIPQLFGFHEGAHASSHLSNLDGFAIALSGAIFGLIGCIYMFKTLVLLIPTRAIFITFVSFFGTSAYHYSTFDSQFSHSVSFMFISFLLFNCFRKFESIWKFSFLMAIVLGCIFLIRPTNLLISIVIFPALLHNFEVKTTYNFARALVWWLAIIASAGTIFIAIQGTLWYLATGQILINAYAVPSAMGGFALSNLRNLPQVLWGPEGLLLFSPAIGFALIGLAGWFPTIKRMKMISIQISIICAFFVITLWPTAIRMGGFGQRMFADFIPLISIGLASLYSRLIKLKYPTSPLSYALAICVCLNLYQMFSYWLGNWENSRFLFNVLH